MSLQTKPEPTSSAGGVSSNRTTFDNLPDSGYLRQAQLIPDVVPISSSTLWRMVNDGRFPRPHKLSSRVTAWTVGSVREYLAKCAEVAK